MRRPESVVTNEAHAGEAAGDLLLEDGEDLVAAEQVIPKLADGLAVQRAEPCRHVHRLHGLGAARPHHPIGLASVRSDHVASPLDGGEDSIAGIAGSALHWIRRPRTRRLLDYSGSACAPGKRKREDICQRMLELRRSSSSRRRPWWRFSSPRGGATACSVTSSTTWPAPAISTGATSITRRCRSWCWRVFARCSAIRCSRCESSPRCFSVSSCGWPRGSLVRWAVDASPSRSRRWRWPSLRST